VNFVKNETIAFLIEKEKREKVKKKNKHYMEDLYILAVLLVRDLNFCLLYIKILKEEQ